VDHDLLVGDEVDGLFEADGRSGAPGTGGVVEGSLAGAQGEHDGRGHKTYPEE
jgi:hypothetical protein